MYWKGCLRLDGGRNVFKGSDGFKGGTEMASGPSGKRWMGDMVSLMDLRFRRSASFVAVKALDWGSGSLELMGEMDRDRACRVFSSELKKPQVGLKTDGWGATI